MLSGACASPALRALADFRRLTSFQVTTDSYATDKGETCDDEESADAVVALLRMPSLRRVALEIGVDHWNAAVGRLTATAAVSRIDTLALVVRAIMLKLSSSRHALHDCC